MHPLRLLGRVASGAGHLVAMAAFGIAVLFSASLDVVLGIVARLYDRFDAGWSRMAQDARARRAREGHGMVEPIAPERD